MSDRTLDIRNDRTQLSTIFDALSDGILICDLDGAILEINETARHLFAGDRQAMIGRPIGHLAMEHSTDPQREVLSWLTEAELGTAEIFEWHCRGQAGRQFWAEMTMRRIALAGHAVGLAVIRDITERKLALDALLQAARRDLWTGLPNRQDFDDVLQHEIARYERYGGYLCIAVGQIDELPAVYEKFGPHVADEVFKNVAGFLRGRLRKSDYLARSGDEEFALLIHDSRPDNAARMLNRMRSALQHQTIPEIDQPVTLSFGLTGYRLTDTPDELLTRLGQALALAKSTGHHHRVVTG